MGSGMAPEHCVHDRFFASIEHPGVVRNEHRGCESLGGLKAIQNSFVKGVAIDPLSFHLNANDNLRKPASAQEVTTGNLLLKITVPRRTGRKRKRGNDKPFEMYQDDQEELGPRDSKDLVRSLRDNCSGYSVQVSGSIVETFRFRALPDFQYSLMSSTLAKDFQQKVLSCNASRLRGFHFSQHKSNDTGIEDMVSPPSINYNTYPFVYGYNQNPFVKRVIGDEGREMMFNTKQVNRGGAKGITHNKEEVPAGPDTDLPPIQSLDPSMQKVIYELRQLFQERPIMTRRFVLNRLGRDIFYDLRFASQYCGYAILSGPWRDTMVRFGLDPRQDPEMRKFQTLTVKLAFGGEKEKDNKEQTERHFGRVETGTHKESHIFDGKTIVPDGSVWQMCDIVDPQLAPVMAVLPRKICQLSTWGWYPVVALAKIQVILRDKIRSLLGGEELKEDDYEVVLRIPDRLVVSPVREEELGYLSNKQRRLWTAIRHLSYFDKQRLSQRDAQEGTGELEVELDKDGQGS